MVELVDTSDLKSDSNKSIGSSPITSKILIAKMMELVDMLGLGSSSLKSRGSSPLFGKSSYYVKNKKLLCQHTINFVKLNERKRKKLIRPQL